VQRPSGRASEARPSPQGVPPLAAIEERLLGFGRHYEHVAQPFEWEFTRDDLDRLLERLDTSSRTTALAA
jgi:YD repeat-containing protein